MCVCAYAYILIHIHIIHESGDCETSVLDLIFTYVPFLQAVLVTLFKLYLQSLWQEDEIYEQ